MTVDLELCDRFVAFLRAFAVGEAQAKTAATLCAGLDLPDTPQSRRNLRACAQHASKAGHLVCSGNAGYFVPASAQEAKGTVGRLRSEAHEMLARATRTERLMARTFGNPESGIRGERPALFGLMEAEA